MSQLRSSLDEYKPIFERTHPNMRLIYINLIIKYFQRALSNKCSRKEHRNHNSNIKTSQNCNLTLQNELSR